MIFDIAIEIEIDFLYDSNLIKNDQTRTGNICYKYVKRIVPRDSNSFEPQRSLHIADCGFALGAMHGCSGESDYAFAFCQSR